MSEEQLAVVRACGLGNVVVDSVAGSGKTTTCILLAKTYPFEKNLLLTYNSKLKLETRIRVREQGLSNLEVHSYHSFCVKYYDPGAYEDVKVHALIKKNRVPLKKIRFDRIVLDETQDMTPMLYQLFHKIYRDNGVARLCVLGDKKQSIYEYRKADVRYLTMAPAIFPGAWTRTELTTTYRLTIPMATFVNECMLKENRLHAVKPSSVQPRYIICDPFNQYKMGEMVMALLEKYAPSDLFLVAYSIKSAKCPLRKLENYLVQKQVPCFVPINDDAVVDDEILQGKVALTTIHQTKGMERKVVVIVGFDSTYYWYHKNADKCVCSNELYVAATRATEVLIMIHGHQQDYLPFLRRDALEKYIEYVDEPDLKEVYEEAPHRRMVCVADLLQHQDSLVLQEAFEQLSCETLQEAGELLDIECKVKGDTVESVAHLTGSAIPAFYEGAVKGRISILEKLSLREDFGNVQRYNHTNTLLQAQRNHPLIRGLQDLTCPMSAAEILFVANCWNAETNGYLSQIAQIKAYDWLSKETLGECIERLDVFMRRVQMAPEKFEHFLIKPENALVLNPTKARVPPTHPEPHPELKGRVLCGYADVVDADHLVEIKCVKKLQKEHYLQLALYMYLDGRASNYLFNVLTGELVRVQCADLPAVVELLMGAKYREHARCSDEQFLKSCVVPKAQATLQSFFEPISEPSKK
jgi:hypothetical protein